MTNVVGILVMVLIATQLGVKDAVSRISDSDVVDPAAVADAVDRVLEILQQFRDGGPRDLHRPLQRLLRMHHAIDAAVTVVADEAVLINRDWVDPNAFAGLDRTAELLSQPGEDDDPLRDDPRFIEIVKDLGIPNGYDPVRKTAIWP